MKVGVWTVEGKIGLTNFDKKISGVIATNAITPEVFFEIIQTLRGECPSPTLSPQGQTAR